MFAGKGIVASSRISPLLPVWPVASILPAGKDVRRKRGKDEDAREMPSNSKGKKKGRKHIDLYA